MRRNFLRMRLDGIHRQQGNNNNHPDELARALIHVNLDQDEGSLSNAIQYTHNAIRDIASVFMQGQFFFLRNGMGLQLYNMVMNEERIRTWFRNNPGLPEDIFHQCLVLFLEYERNYVRRQEFINNHGQLLGSVTEFEFNENAIQGLGDVGSAEEIFRISAMQRDGTEKIIVTMVIWPI